MADFTKKIKKFDDYYSVKGATVDAIAEAESRLGLHFSSEYKSYLADCGAASADGHEFTGIIPSARLNVVDVTEKNRTRNPNAPDNLYVVEEVQIDGITIWQSEDGSVYLSTGTQKPYKTHASLADYIG